MKQLLLIITLIALTFSSCNVNRVYTPANYGVTKRYIAKPIYKDKDVSATYISLGVSTGKHPYSSEEIADTKFIGSLNIHQSKSIKRFNFYYGIGFSYGNFNFKNSLDDVIKQNESQSFYIINPKIGMSIKKSSSKFDFHFIGMELNYNYENGAYQDKLSKITPSESIIIVNEKSLLSYNLSSEILYKINANNTIGLGIFAGDIIGLDTDKYNVGNAGTGFGGLTFSYRIKKLTLSTVSQSASRNIESISFGASYEF